MSTRKELKEQYKQIEPSMGVFQIRSLVNNKVLIDNSLDMKARWNRDRFQLNFGSHQNKALQEDWSKLGEASFVFEVLSELKRKDDGNADYPKELEALQDLTIEELKIGEELIYW